MGAVLARELGADLNVALSTKLRAPGQRGLAIGAIAEDGQTYVNHFVEDVAGVTDSYLAKECQDRQIQIARY